VKGWTVTAISKPDRPQEGIDRGRVVRFLLALPVYFAVFMFVPAGTWDWFHD